jgi:hypothetical protein
MEATHSFEESRYLGFALPYGMIMIASERLAGSEEKTLSSNQSRKTFNSFIYVSYSSEVTPLPIPLKRC